MHSFRSLPGGVRANLQVPGLLQGPAPCCPGQQEVSDLLWTARNGGVNQHPRVSQGTVSAALTMWTHSFPVDLLYEMEALRVFLKRTPLFLTGGDVESHCPMVPGSPPPGQLPAPEEDDLQRNMFLY